MIARAARRRAGRDLACNLDRVPSASRTGRAGPVRLPIENGRGANRRSCDDDEVACGFGRERLRAVWKALRSDIAAAPPWPGSFGQVEMRRRRGRDCALPAGGQTHAARQRGENAGKQKKRFAGALLTADSGRPMGRLRHTDTAVCGLRIERNGRSSDCARQSINEMKPESVMVSDHALRTERMYRPVTMSRRFNPPSAETRERAPDPTPSTANSSTRYRFPRFQGRATADPRRNHAVIVNCPSTARAG